jgi:hypothetical protein
MAAQDSRFQKTFYTDSGLTKGTGKRSIQPPASNENDFFSLGYQQQHNGQHQRSHEQSNNGGNSQLDAPWGTSSNLNRQDYSRPQPVSEPSSDNLSNRQQKAKRPPPGQDDKVNNELKKIDHFYNENPEFKVESDHHRHRKAQEAQKGVPWGTLEDLNAPAGSLDNYHGGKAHGSAAPGGRQPAPFATANDVVSEPAGRAKAGQQESRVVSQITF